MKVNCPNCRTTFRVDPRKVPVTGARARCSVCQGVFFVPAPQRGESPSGAGARSESVMPRPSAPSANPVPRLAEPPSPSVAPGTAGRTPPAAAAAGASSPFSATDPQAKARRLARALISDIVTYHPERRDQSLRDGTLKQEFKDEIRKSWEEYVGQVGLETAHGSTHFRDALNEILARGNSIF